MKWGKTLLLIVVLALLGGYFYVYEVRLATQRKQAEELKKQEAWRKSQLFPFEPQSFLRIRLVKDGRVIEYQKEEAVWWMREPQVVRGSERTVDGIIQSIIDVVETDPIADNPDDLVQFGLDYPAMEISIQLEGEEKEHTLLCGSDNPTSTTIYAQLKGSPRVFLVGSLIRWEVSKEFYNLDHHTGPFFTSKEVL